MTKNKKLKIVSIVLRMLLIIYLIASAVYIWKRIDFAGTAEQLPAYDHASYGFLSDFIRMFMGLPSYADSHEGFVGKAYILSSVLRIIAALLLTASFFRRPAVEVRKTETIWKDRKRNLFGLPWSFTEYSMTEDRLFLKRGILNTRYDEVRLYRIRDNSLTRSLWQRITRTGTVHLTTSDTSLGNFDLKNITDPESVNEFLSEKIDEARKKNRVIAREAMEVSEHNDAEIEAEGTESENDSQNDQSED